MKSFILLTIVALASARSSKNDYNTRFGTSGIEELLKEVSQQRSSLQQTSRLFQTPFQQMIQAPQRTGVYGNIDLSQQVTRQALQRTLAQGGAQGNGQIVAAQAAQQIVRGAEEEQQLNIQETIKELAQRAQVTGLNTFGGQNVAQTLFQQARQGEIQQVIEELVKQQQKQAQPGSTGQLLQQTLQVGIEAQLATQIVQRLGLQGQAEAEEFQGEVQQLVDQINAQQTQKSICDCQQKAKQIQAQRQFVTQQIKKVEAQETVARQIGGCGQGCMQLQQVKAKLQQLERFLAQEQLAQSVAVQQLQKVLIKQESQIQDDIVEQQVAKNSV
ncbi:uncharacterized protein LOC115886552 [Sitophilus oryzae]|uniref:Uncharacterized protein LOC115886552 n=1 Tax=Sitophilus oryzae TaxID=7048 RepID=A0A6J2YFH3_SITOR|nr:uncharacterized protein LOC115886552 [Sitophilus oryzae]